ncbi:MAG: hypothetical protein ACXWEI_08955, partial [Mycobacterium sp.]
MNAFRPNRGVRYVNLERTFYRRHDQLLGRWRPQPVGKPGEVPPRELVRTDVMHCGESGGAAYLRHLVGGVVADERRAGACGIHVAAGTPVRIGIGQTHAHGVFETSADRPRRAARATQCVATAVLSG